MANELEIMRFKQYFESVDSLNRFVEFQQKENGLEFEWNAVRLCAWGNFPAEVVAELESQKGNNCE